MLTAAQFILYMQHALGKTPAAGHSLYDTFNQAGRQLFAASDWNWLFTGPTSVTAVADVPYLTLPADFKRIIASYIDNTSGISNFSIVRQTTLEAIARMYENNLATVNYGAFWVCFQAYRSTTSLTDAPVPIAPCYPLPTTTNIPTIKITYRRGWEEITASNGTAEPNMPDEWEGALKHLSCALALAIEDSDQPQKGAQHMALYGAEIERLIQFDGEAQWDYGVIEPGGPYYSVGRIPIGTIDLP